MNRTLDLCSQGVAAPLSQAEDVEIRRHTRNCFRIVRRIPRCGEITIAHEDPTSRRRSPKLTNPQPRWLHSACSYGAFLSPQTQAGSGSSIEHLTQRIQHLLAPELVARVEHRQLTDSGKLRAHPFGFRDDKDPQECTFDQLQSVAGQG